MIRQFRCLLPGYGFPLLLAGCAFMPQGGERPEFHDPPPMDRTLSKAKGEGPTALLDAWPQDAWWRQLGSRSTASWSLRIVTNPSDPLPSDLASAHALILAQRELLAKEQSLRIAAESEVKFGALEIERLKLMLAKARRAQFGQFSERGQQLIEQLELAIEDLEETLSGFRKGDNRP